MKQRLLFYNASIRYFLHYVNTIWTSCDKKNLGRVSMHRKKEQQRQFPTLMTRRLWPHFYKESKVVKCFVAYKRIKGEVS
ncbi:unnamed protein product [Pocillopora meandrina]|uniref:Uncharacterized protein n=1 Tax=Pocillopora meandrina TaxID=46732 RepID=A0AAU9XEA9_9CNID|nr:unnamed protein product [Pocillopora meandrina]